MLLPAFLGCRSSATGTKTDGGADANSDFPFPRPRTDLVPSVGTDATLEFATWNIENYPRNAATPGLAADLIASMDLDLVAFQEITDIDAFNELVSRLRGYESILSSHSYGDGSYQKVGFVYRSELLTLRNPFLLFAQQGYEFPRPVLKVDIEVASESGDYNFTALALHLKAGGGFENSKRREDAMVVLADYLKTAAQDNSSGILVLGDFNTTMEDGVEAFAPLTDFPELYTVRSATNEANGEFSFVPFESLIDHVVTTADFDAELPGNSAIIPRLDTQMSTYLDMVSDHLPVIIRVDL